MTDRQIIRLLALFAMLMAVAGLAGCGEPRLPDQATGGLGIGGGSTTTTPEPTAQLPDQATGDFGTVGGGLDNRAGGKYATVCGGSHNSASAYHATVGGGFYNTASVEASVVGGGERNTASARFATVAGGYNNAASRGGATVSGGAGNTASGKLATVGGGFRNTASGWGGTVTGGRGNTASGMYPTVGGGAENTATGHDATVSGGAGNTASANHATVGGGLANRAAGIYATAGGGYNNTGGGSFSTVPGGFRNEAAGDYSFASGRRAIIDAAHDGAFLYADSNDFSFHSAAADEFAVRATGGVRLVTAIDSSGNPVSGVELASGSGSWSSLSDREAKANVAPVDEDQILTLLAELPISTWNYAGQDPSIRHLGPMAQDFRAAFDLGEDDKHISTVDADGVALAAIQGLHQLVQERDTQIAALEARVAALEQANRTNGSQARPFPSGTATNWLLLGGLCLAGVVLGRIGFRTRVT